MNAPLTLQPQLVARVEREFRVIRQHMLSALKVMDAAGGMPEAVHSLRLSLTSLDDCLDALNPEPELPTTELPRHHMEDVFVRGDTIADDRRDDLMMDADRSES